MALRLLPHAIVVAAVLVYWTWLREQQAPVYSGPGYGSGTRELTDGTVVDYQVGEDVAYAADANSSAIRYAADSGFRSRRAISDAVVLVGAMIAFAMLAAKRWPRSKNFLPDA